MLHDKTHFMLC